MSRPRKLLHEYMQGNREAVVLDAPEGLEVDLYEDEYLIETRQVYENWVMRVIK